MKNISLISIILSLFYVSTDFATRFFDEPVSSNNTKQGSNNVRGIVLPQLSAGQLQALTVAFDKYQPKQAIVNKTQETIDGLTAEQQLQQNGELLEFYQGDWRYRLLAVISPDGSNQALKTPLALLKGTNIKDTTVKSKIEKIYHQSTLANYNVIITNTKQVKLHYRQQNITLLMYQPKK